jgi:hypothetical protein
VVPVTSNGTPHPFLRVFFDTRSYSDRSNRLDITVDNTLNQAGATAVTYSVDIVSNGVTLYHHDTLTHYYLTRWRKVFDLGMTESRVTPDIELMQVAGAIPRYTSLVDSNVDYSTGPTYDILGIGGLTNNDMGTPGEDARIGVLPWWEARYIVHRNHTELQTIMANGDLSGSWPLHLTMADGNPPNIDQNPTLWFESRGGTYGTTGPAGNMTAVGPLIVDTSHTPSLDYFPYLVSGDRYYADEMRHWAAWGIAAESPAYRNGSAALIQPSYIQTRSLPWQLRDFAEAAAYLPDNDPFRAYFAAKLQSNLDWMDTMATTPATSINTPFQLGPFGIVFGPISNVGLGVAVWQLGYLNWSIATSTACKSPACPGA